MNKLNKIVSIIVLIVAVLSMSTVVNAFSNSDVIDYVTRAHTVNGRTERLDAADRQSLTKYLQENPVTDSEADEIIGKLDKAKAEIEKTGATSLSQMSDSVKAEVSSLVKSAGTIAGLDVQLNTINETVTVKSLKDGKTIISATSYQELNTTPTNPSPSNPNNPAPKKPGKLVYTGNNSIIIETIVAIVAVASVVCIVRKIRNAK